MLCNHAWPGNVRELRNVIERALVLSNGQPLGVQHLPHELWRGTLPAEAPAPPATDLSLEEVTKRHVIAVFQSTGENVTRAAGRLGISRLALRRRLQLYGLKKPLRD